MTKEDKELLLKDLSARIPYGVKIEIPSVFAGRESLQGVYRNYVTNESGDTVDVEKALIYLRPMSSMTREECTQLNVLLPRYFIVTPERLNCLEHINGGIINFEVLDTIIDFYNSHHLDWRGLIPKGLALEAKEGMYNIKWVAWIEKQGEPTDIPADAILDSNKDGLIADTIRCKIGKQGEQKPACNEEDEEIINALISFCNAAKEAHPQVSVGALVNWLKSLKDRVH